MLFPQHRLCQGPPVHSVTIEVRSECDMRVTMAELNLLMLDPVDRLQIRPSENYTLIDDTTHVKDVFMLKCLPTDRAGRYLHIG